MPKLAGINNYRLKELTRWCKHNGTTLHRLQRKTWILRLAWDEMNRPDWYSRLGRELTRCLHAEPRFTDKLAVLRPDWFEAVTYAPGTPRGPLRQPIYNSFEEAFVDCLDLPI